MTTQFQPPQPPGVINEPSYGPPKPPPWSKAAVGGFVCSLLGCLGVTAVVGLILGIVGTFKASGGKRRGMGLAIAAIPLSLVTGFCFIGGGVLYVVTKALVAVSEDVETALKLEGEGHEEAARAFSDLGSADFNSEVTTADLTDWLDQLGERYGTFVEVLPLSGGSDIQRTPDGRTVLNYKGKFVNETVDVRIEVISEGGFGKMRINHIEIGGLSPRAGPEGQP